MRSSMRVLMDEHIALKGAARILKMEAAILDSGKDADIALLQIIVDYIQNFPDRIHHPKEERYLFKAMRERSPEAAGILDRLLREHQREDQMIGELTAAVEAYAADKAGGRESVARIAREYSEFLEAHVKLENVEAFPLAEKILTEEDWAVIDTAFADNDDPMLGGPEREKFASLYKRISDLGLPPIGLRSK